jgi:hypothetical protein
MESVHSVDLGVDGRILLNVSSLAPRKTFIICIFLRYFLSDDIRKKRRIRCTTNEEKKTNSFEIHRPAETLQGRIIGLSKCTGSIGK